MAYQKLQCDNCQGKIVYDHSTKKYVCEYCQTEYLPTEIPEKERLLTNAETQRLRIKDIEKAFQIYRQVTEDYPDDFRGWLGLAEIVSDNFNNVDLHHEKYRTLSTYVRNTLEFAPDEQKKIIEKQWSIYQSKHSSFIEQKRTELKALYVKKKSTEKQIEISRRNQSDLNKKSSSVWHKVCKSNSKGIGNFLKNLFIISVFIVILSLIFDNPKLIQSGMYILVFYTIFRIVAAFNSVRLKKKYTQLDNKSKAENANELNLYGVVRNITDNIRILEEKYNIRNI